MSAGEGEVSAETRVEFAQQQLAGGRPSFCCFGSRVSNAVGTLPFMVFQGRDPERFEERTCCELAARLHRFGTLALLSDWSSVTIPLRELYHRTGSR